MSSAEDHEELTGEERAALFEAARAIAGMQMDPTDAEALMVTFAELRAVDRSVLDTMTIQLIHLAKLSYEQPGMTDDERRKASQRAAAFLHLSRIVYLAWSRGTP